MRVVLTAIVGFALSFLAINQIDSASATHLGTDLVLFQASTRGSDYDGDGRLEWCWTGYYHGRFGNALDEVPQTGSSSCPSLSTEKVDLMSYAWTSWTSCYVSNPCLSLKVNGTTGVYNDGCDFIEATLRDVSTNAWKGKQRMIHARSSSGWTVYLRAANNGYFLNWWEIGTVVYDSNCGGGWTNYHVHHDFDGPTTSSCWSSTNGLSSSSKNWEKQNSSHWIHGLTHQYGHGC